MWVVIICSHLTKAVLYYSKIDNENTICLQNEIKVIPYDDKDFLVISVKTWPWKCDHSV